METIKIVKFVEDKKEENECSICLENIEEDSKKIVKCGHMFHTECISKWLEAHDKCPLCIQTIIEVEVEEKNKEPENVTETVNRRINIFGVFFCIIMIFTVVCFVIFEIIQKSI